MGRFRIKRGEFELEYEGEDSATKYQLALEWVRTLGRLAQLETPESTRKVAAEEGDEGNVEERSRTRRGRGQGAIAKSKIVGVLIPSGFLGAPKSNEEITNELSRKGWPVPGKRVSDALILLVKEGKLDRFGNRGNYKYACSSESEKSRQ